MKTWVLITAALAAVILGSAIALAYVGSGQGDSWLDAMKEHHEETHGDDFDQHHEDHHGEGWRERMAACHGDADGNGVEQGYGMDMGAGMMWA